MEDIVTFDHLNIYDLNPNNDFDELNHVMGVLDKSDAGVYILNETG